MTGRRERGGSEGHLMVTLRPSHLLKYIHIYTYIERKNEGVKGKWGGRGGWSLDGHSWNFTFIKLYTYICLKKRESKRK